MEEADFMNIVAQKINMPLLYAFKMGKLNVGFEFLPLEPKTTEGWL